MSYTDTHCHLQDSRFADALPDVLARAKRAGVTRFVCCGTVDSDWNNILQLANHEIGVIPMLGLHPWYIGETKPGWDRHLHHLLKDNPAGVGECGLDFAIPDTNHESQITALEIQWRMAMELGRPLSLHCRKAFDAIFEIAKNYGLPSKGAVIHAFSGSVEQAKIAIQHGFYLSFACSLMNPKNKRARKAILAVPLERLLLETDSPDISPIPETFNEPANLVPLHNVAAELMNETLDNLAKQIQQNVVKIWELSI
jgi:TatD DNase family protein